MPLDQLDTEERRLLRAIMGRLRRLPQLDLERPLRFRKSLPRVPAGELIGRFTGHPLPVPREQAGGH